MPKPEGVPKKKLFCQNLRGVPKKPKKQSSRSLGAWRPPEFCFFFWYFLRFWQGFQEKYCQNLRRYQKNQSLEVKILPKPEEVPKKPKKTKFRRSWAWRSQEFWFFWYRLRFWQGFQEKYCQNPRRYQKNQSLEMKILPSSGFGKIFISRLWFFWYLLRFWQYFS